MLIGSTLCTGGIMSNYNIYVEKADPEEISKQTCGIYAIIQPDKKSAYVGLAINIYSRWFSHIDSICFNYNNGSNENLVNETEKNFRILRVYAPKLEYSNDPSSDKEQYIHETLVMDIFCSMGYSLYNGNSAGKDDRGLKRAHLFLNNDKKDQNRWQETKTALNSFQNQNDPYWETLRGTIEQDVKVAVKNALSDAFLSGDRSYHINDELSRVKCKAIMNNEYVENTPLINELKSYGLELMKPEQVCEMIDSEAFNTIIYHVFGNYMDQTYQTIFSTKQYDLNHNKMVDLAGIDPTDSNAPVCFWSMKRLSEDAYSKLSKNGEYRGKRYMLMQYTPSQNKAGDDKESGSFLNPHDGESIDDFHDRLLDVQKNNPEKYSFLTQYAISSEKETAKDIHYPYPKNMFPSVNETHEKQYILLISKLYYIDTQIDNKTKIRQCFQSNANNGSNDISERIRESAFCTSPFEEKRNDLKELLSKKSKNGKTLFLVAELSYPYMVYLPGNPQPLLSHYLGYYKDGFDNPHYMIIEHKNGDTFRYVLCGRKIWIDNDVTDITEVRRQIPEVNPDGYYQLDVTGMGDDLQEHIMIHFTNGENKTISLCNRNRKNRNKNYQFGEKEYCAVIFRDENSQDSIIFLSEDEINIHLDGSILL